MHMLTITQHLEIMQIEKYAAQHVVINIRWVC